VSPFSSLHVFQDPALVPGRSGIHVHVIHPECAALDLGKDVVVAAIRLQDGAEIKRECRTFGATGRQLLSLASWLEHEGVTHVVMEATGSYWKVVWHVLESRFVLTLANPAHIKNVPGRKSDMNDATWMADIHAHGLVRGSFVPPREIGALRDLTRTRKQFVREINRHTQRIQKTLDIAGIKLTGVVSEVLGVSGRAILRALVAGETDPRKLAELGHPRLRASRDRLEEALQGLLDDHQRRLIGMHLGLIEALQSSIAQLDVEIVKAVMPFRAIVERLQAVPGLSAINTPAIVAEIGIDMSRFATHRHLLSWARLCPRLDESAGKVHSTRTMKGAVWIKELMIQAAWAAIKTKNTYFRAQFLRLKARRGSQKAIVAVAASLLTTVYYLIRDGRNYIDLGADHFVTRDRSQAARRLVSRLRQLGYNVSVKEAVA
jgi:transposase